MPSFPDVDLPLGVAVAFGANPDGSPGTWTFENLTSRLIRTRAVTSSVTRRPQAYVHDASLCSVPLSNDDGALTPKRAMSTYWPNVKLDVPAKLTLRRCDDTFTRTTSNGWGTSDTGHVWANSGGANSDYSTTGTQGSVAVSATGSDRITVVDIDGPHQDVLITSSTNGTPAGATIDTGVVARYTDSSNFYIGVARVSTGGTITAVIAKRVAGVLTDVSTVATGLSTGTSKMIRFRVINDRLQLKIWLTSATEPDAWHLDLFDSSLTAGDSAGSYSRRATSSTGVTTFTYDNFDTTHTLDAGFSDAWKTDIIPTTEVPADEMSVSQLVFSGPVKRLSQGRKPLRSPLFRSLTNIRGEFLPRAYWSLEDGSDATQFASGVPGGTPMLFTGDISLALDGSLPGSAPLPTFGATGRASGSVAVYTDTDYWLAAAIIYVPSTLSASTNVTVLSVPINSPSLGTLTVFLNIAAGELGMTRYLPSGAVDASTSTGWDASAGTVLDNWVWVTLTCRKDEFGSDDHAQANLYALTPGGASFGSLGEIIGATGYGMATGVGVNGALCPAPAGGEGIRYGHTWLMTDPQFDITGDTRDYIAPAMAYVDETAADRLRRLCLEEGVPIAVAAGDTDGMGPQQIDTFWNNLALCAETDLGVLGEDGFSLSYIPRTARYRRPVSMTIDLSTYRTPAGTSAQVLAPVYDAQEYRNEWTVTNINGTTAVASDTTVSPLRRDESATIAVQPDARIQQNASWRTHVSSHDANRYQTVPISLNANPGLIGQWLGAVSGLTRIVRTNLPGKAPDGDVHEILASYSQVLRPREWDIAYSGAPAVPWDVGAYGISRYDSANSSLAAGYDADDTSLSVSTDAGHALWRTGSFTPAFDVEILGIRIPVTAISGGSSPQTFTVQRSADGYDKALASGAQVRLFNPGRYGL